MFCLTLLCVGVCASRDTTTQNNVKQQNIFNILFIILTYGKLKLKNTYVNNCILTLFLRCTI
jgi:hypothetical protein